MSSRYLALVGGDGPGLTHVVRIGSIALGVRHEGCLQRLSRGQQHHLRVVTGRGRRLDSGVRHGTAGVSPDVQRESPSCDAPVRRKPNLHSSSL